LFGLASPADHPNVDGGLLLTGDDGTVTEAGGVMDSASPGVAPNLAASAAQPATAFIPTNESLANRFAAPGAKVQPSEVSPIPLPLIPAKPEQRGSARPC